MASASDSLLSEAVGVDSSVYITLSVSTTRSGVYVKLVKGTVSRSPGYANHTNFAYFRSGQEPHEQQEHLRLFSEEPLVLGAEAHGVHLLADVFELEALDLLLPQSRPLLGGISVLGRAGIRSTTRRGSSGLFPMLPCLPSPPPRMIRRVLPNSTNPGDRCVLSR